jgi:rubrerythrin
MSDIFDFAMQMESDAADYYRDLATKCEDQGLANILNRLAAAELEHEKVLAAMKAATPVDDAQTDFLSDVKNIFSEMKGKETEYDFDLSTVDLYRKAQEHEKRSEELYRQKAREAETDAQRQILERIADEEREHYVVLQNIIDFVNQPNIWLEDAEWRNIEL